MNWKEKLLAAIGGAAVALVQKYESTVLRSFRDPVCIVTACTGHTGPELKMTRPTPASSARRCSTRT